ncbi:sugar transferase [Guggenheimella bovis]
MIVKRIFDFTASFFGLIVLLPFFIIFAPILILTNGLPILFKQERIGKNGVPFKILKLRTMKDEKGPMVTKNNDPRITRVGRFLRKTKLDELPQLINVLKGEMSFVGPRPEVKKYVDLYTEEQRKVLQVPPGITDPASIEYRNEGALLEASKDPEKTYIEEIMPKKLSMNLEYLEERTFLKDIGIIFKTIFG